MNLTITDHGDESVGIFPVSWTVECPIDETEEPEYLSLFKHLMTQAYGQFANGRVTAMYDFEQKQLEEQYNVQFCEYQVFLKGSSLKPKTVRLAGPSVGDVINLTEGAGAPIISTIVEVDELNRAIQVEWNPLS